MIDLYIPELRLPSLANMRGRWKITNEISSQRKVVSMFWPRSKQLPDKPTEHCGLWFVFTRFGPRLLDRDNLANSCKAVQDQACEECGVKDGDPGVYPLHHQEKCKNYGVRIFAFNAPKCKCECCLRNPKDPRPRMDKAR